MELLFTTWKFEENTGMSKTSAIGRCMVHINSLCRKLFGWQSFKFWAYIIPRHEYTGTVYTMTYWTSVLQRTLSHHNSRLHAEDNFCCHIILPLELDKKWIWQSVKYTKIAGAAVHWVHEVMHKSLDTFSKLQFLLNIYIYCSY